MHCALHTPQILGNNAVPTDGQRTDVVTPPVPVQTPQPGAIPTGDHFEYQGTAVLEIEVNAGGNVTHAKVIKPVGYGLDEKALERATTGDDGRFRLNVPRTLLTIRATSRGAGDCVSRTSHAT